MFQQAAEYNVRMTNILLRIYDLEIKKSRFLKRRIDLFKICKELWRRSRSLK
jgi:hypothetical protein